MVYRVVSTVKNFGKPKEYLTNRSITGQKDPYAHRVDRVNGLYVVEQ